MLIKSDEVSCNKFMYNYIKVKRDARPCSGSAQSTLMALKCAVITTNVARELVCDTARDRLWSRPDSQTDRPNAIDNTHVPDSSQNRERNKSLQDSCFFLH